MLKKLTEAEFNVLKGYSKGMTLADIAKTLHYTKTTVNVYLYLARKKIFKDKKSTNSQLLLYFLDNTGMLNEEWNYINKERKNNDT